VPAPTSKRASLRRTAVAAHHDRDPQSRAWRGASNLPEGELNCQVHAQAVLRMILGNDNAVEDALYDTQARRFARPRPPGAGPLTVTRRSSTSRCVYTRAVISGLTCPRTRWVTTRGHVAPRHISRRRVPQGVDVYEPPGRVTPGDPRPVQDPTEDPPRPGRGRVPGRPVGTEEDPVAWLDQPPPDPHTDRRASSSSTSSTRRGIDRWRLVLVVSARSVRARFSTSRSAHVAWVSSPQRAPVSSSARQSVA
jgi:hypothetical protein